MLIKDINKVVSLLAGDKTTIKEVLHPKNDAIDIPYSIAMATLEVGQKSIPHQLEGSEVYIITKGSGKVYIDEKAALVTVNQLVYIPPNATQWIENTGEERLEFLCIVHPFWKREEEVVL